MNRETVRRRRPRLDHTFQQLLFVGLTLLAAPIGLDAQPQPPTIAGAVVDSTGGAMVGVTVTLTSGDSERHAVTDSAGRFSFEGVAAGAASLTVRADHFSPATVGVSSARTEIRVVLQPVSLIESVMVRGMPAGRMLTATKTETPLRDVPQAISVVSKDTMAALSMTSMADVVRYVAGIGFAQGEGNRDTPVFRGNSSTSDFYVDGVRDDVQYYRDVYNLERVEALKGPNAMIFGRGGVGGVINRVQRVAGWTPVRELSFQVGSHDNRRVSTDLNHPISSKVALRLTGVYEKTDTFRSGVGLERSGVNPTISASLGTKTVVRGGFEYFHDDRTADRGIPSYQGRPLSVDPSLFFGNAVASNSAVTANSTFALVEHTFSDRATLRSRTSYGDYDKTYQNIFPGALNGAGTTVSISGYHNATRRKNVFNQTDLTLRHRRGRVDHAILAGLEIGRQETDNFRNTAFFTTIGPTTTTLTLPVTAPTTSLPVEFRQGATDTDNHGIATVAAVYAQDQVSLTEQIQALVGVRFDRFNVGLHNNRTNAGLSSDDARLSPRLGVIYKPITPVSIYGSYGLAFQPRAGEQLSSLSLTNQALDPETFRNYEAGLKWETESGRSFTLAVYHLKRGNVAITDPNDPAISLLVDAQRTRGVEMSVGGRIAEWWSVLGAYAHQDGQITRALSASVPAGAMLANLPKNSFSLWNRYDASRRLGIGLGLIYRSDLFTATDNTVVLPSYFRADAAVYFTSSRRFSAQVNIENLFDETYYASANGNNNITPGSPRALRASLTTRF